MSAESPRAFPSQPSDYYGGMTLRQYYAGKALQGAVASPHFLAACGKTAKAEDRDPAEVVATSCFEFADAMIAQGEKGEQG